MCVRWSLIKLRELALAFTTTQFLWFFDIFRVHSHFPLKLRINLLSFKPGKNVFVGTKFYRCLVLARVFFQNAMLELFITELMTLELIFC